MTLKTVLFGAALACSLFAAPAVAKEKSSEAEDVTTADLSGEWSFIANTGDDCSFTGKKTHVTSSVVVCVAMFCSAPIT